MGTGNRSTTAVQARFATVPPPKIERSRLDRSAGHKTTFDGGDLVPVFLDEVLPGDTWEMSTIAFARVATLLKPLMENIFLDVFFFFVPCRLVWEHWVNMCGEQAAPGDPTDYEVPQVTAGVGGWALGSVADRMGVPPLVNLTHSALPLRAYNLLWNQWFRDENLQDPVTVPLDDGPDDPADYVLLKRGKRHDYFTSCLPWVLKGDAVSLPLGTSAPLVTTGLGIPTMWTGAVSAAALLGTLSAYTAEWTELGDGSAASWADPALEVDLTAATAATVNQLREAIALQELLERDARAGTRYPELLLSQYGVQSSDQRLQRCEYLGSGTIPIMVTPVAQTAWSTSGLGNLGAFATAIGQAVSWSRSFEEHGFILGVASARADLTYQQGLPRLWSRKTRLDHYWPALAHLGEQAVLNKEIYAQGVAADEDVFGYQERWSEYRYRPSYTSDRMRSQAATTLDVWHLGQEFGSLPTLGPDFIVDAPPFNRVTAVVSEPDFVCDWHFRLYCTRPMPVRSIPGLGSRL